MRPISNVVVNGKAREVDQQTTLAHLVAAAGRDPDRPGTAAALNGQVIPRRAWPETLLRDGDAVEIVAATQGG